MKQIQTLINSFSPSEKDLIKTTSRMIGMRRPFLYHFAILDFCKRKARTHKATDEEKLYIRKMLDDDTLVLPLDLDSWMRGEVTND